jgi:hypothetical protein
MSITSFEQRVYSSYHASLKSARSQLLRSRSPQYCCSNHYAVDPIPHAEIRELALTMAAKRYKVTESQVSHIVRELRIPNPEAKTLALSSATRVKKRIHKR